MALPGLLPDGGSQHLHVQVPPVYAQAVPLLYLESDTTIHSKPPQALPTLVLPVATYPALYYILAGAYSCPVQVINTTSCTVTWYQVKNLGSLLRKFPTGPYLML